MVSLILPYFFAEEKVEFVDLRANRAGGGTFSLKPDTFTLGGKTYKLGASASAQNQYHVNLGIPFIYFETNQMAADFIAAKVMARGPANITVRPVGPGWGLATDEGREGYGFPANSVTFLAGSTDPFEGDTFVLNEDGLPTIVRFSIEPAGVPPSLTSYQLAPGRYRNGFRFTSKAGNSYRINNSFTNDTDGFRINFQNSSDARDFISEGFIVDTGIFDASTFLSSTMTRDGSIARLTSFTQRYVDGLTYYISITEPD